MPNKLERKQTIGSHRMPRLMEALRAAILLGGEPSDLRTGGTLSDGLVLCTIHLQLFRIIFVISRLAYLRNTQSININD